ncbi:2Fe-2S iron-sulfur cluster-binding protein [Janthinobacterium agaricidamnosum]|uniref:Ferredoxin-1 n=1 Tax=Janthinobacterium agaricidamnosum NBRC 102515 = DSM 9628 TaxID=1349767 RepID=W0VA70_9BURK|nr:2Fe-2S iron-sulfur cluster binding domain-containing protein [Janthinobacterium agaricidamnosum]CDG85719.1 ferredoxin-1 [Janthinobacterium agaricidamnosum NBRC 102515 = DSM 9628]
MNPPFTVKIMPQEWEFDAAADVSLLVAAERAGLRLPSSCRNGSCRTCLCRMVSGQVHYRIEWPGLSREEKQEGYILPCVALADSDLVLEATARRRHP